MINVGMNLASESLLRSTASTNPERAVTPERTFAAAQAQQAQQAQQAKSAEQATVEQDKSKKPDDKADVFEAVDTVNQMLMVKSTNLVFEFYDKSDPPVVKVIDKENGEIIREIPSKELREIAKALNNIADNMGTGSGLLFNEKM